jgi:hypothetical protein
LLLSVFGFMSLSIEFFDCISWLPRYRRRTERSNTAQYQRCPMIVVRDLVITEAWYAGVLLNVLLDLVGSRRSGPKHAVAIGHIRWHWSPNTVSCRRPGNLGDQGYATNHFVIVERFLGELRLRCFLGAGSTFQKRPKYCSGRRTPLRGILIRNRQRK